MGRRIITRPITPAEEAEARAIVAKVTWKQSTSEEYKTAPHSYIIKQKFPQEWDRLADLIKNCGVYRTWRGHRFKYLILDGYCYWSMWPVLNRAKSDTILSAGEQALNQDRSPLRS